MKKNVWIHLGMIVAMFVVACIYLSPTLSGKVIVQGDVQKYDAMSYKQRMEKKQTGVVPNWTESMFSGMPGYHVTSKPQTSVFQPVRNTLNMSYFGWERNIGIIFLYLLGFYVAMLAFGVSPWLALIGALAFGLGSYNIIIIEAGHITKAFAISMMAPVIAGMCLVLRSAVDEKMDKKQRTHGFLWGTLLFTFALILQISFNHIQITIYTAIGCVFVGLAYLVTAISHKRIVYFAKAVGILIVGALLAVGCNTRMLFVNQEYVKYTIRGGNELTVTPDDLYNEHTVSDAQITTNGLDIDYAFNWSYGIGETYTLLVPGAMGGGSGEKVDDESSFYKTFHSNQAPLYWGGQPFTSGPVYFGAIVIMLFLLGMIVTRGPERWWILISSILAILLSWGSNFMVFNEWVFNNVPLYNKLRTPSMALVLANVCMAIMAVLALKAIIDPKRDCRRVNKGLYVAVGALVVLILSVLVVSGSFDYSGSSDRQMAAQYGNQWDMIKSVLVSDRAALLRGDSWRSLIFILLAAVAIWLFNNNKIKKPAIMLAVVGVLIVIDMWGVDRRYLSDDNFVDARKVELRRDQWDYAIDEQAAANGDRDYRVFNLAVNTFNDSKPSAFHNQIGGYHAAKLCRYQNIIDFYLSRHINMQVLNMLNTRYIVMQNGQVQRNPDALGNCWFVDEVVAVGSPNDEIIALNTIEPSRTAVVDTSMWKVATGRWASDSLATIAYEPQKTESADYRKYVSHSSKDRLAVFSEIHYAPDWLAYIDGKPAEYIRANYVLRAMVVPAGDHVIEFRNEAPRLVRLNKITLVVSIITLLAMIGAVALVYLPRKKKE